MEVGYVYLKRGIINFPIKFSVVPKKNQCFCENTQNITEIYITCFLK